MHLKSVYFFIIHDKLSPETSQYHFLEQKENYVSVQCINIMYCCYVYSLQVGLPVDQIGPHLSCLCSNDVGGDCSIHSPADIHPLIYLIQYMYKYKSKATWNTRINIRGSITAYSQVLSVNYKLQILYSVYQLIISNNTTPSAYNHLNMPWQLTKLVDS